ncbi:hypothetical protein [Terrisporobacter mayombei]|uniref:Uncharacterized protein n=1 Tax=Terrisporobacter mayombei TaxID=1541 RepID=A0ABY9Q302_9FIRM|nr:hypothetical protein [Terrisporobacter mayombei]MCC3866729.1 hypothetical protein [Terrisporobacter mayombei]WMT80967.1 hypothetical protein TEMA_12960 [Terrisporobacter mayombei]
MKISKGKVIAAILGIIVIAGGVSVYKSSTNDYPYRLIYISEEGNKQEKSQEEAINEALKGLNVKETDFDMLKVDDKGTVVIKQSEYNKLAKDKRLKEVNLSGDEAMIIPRYDGIKNISYLKKQKGIKEFKVKDIDLKIKGVLNKKILITGLFTNQLVVSDKTYEKLSKDSKTLEISGYDYELNKDTKNNVASLFKNKSFSFSNTDRLYYLIGKDSFVE